MADNRISLPQSGGGLVRYSETTGSKVQIGPMGIVVMIIVVIILTALLHALKPF